MGVKEGDEGGLFQSSYPSLTLSINKEQGPQIWKQPVRLHVRRLSRSK